MKRTTTNIRRHLSDLERRALDHGVNETGSASVVIYCAELDALDEAIKLLDPVLYPGIADAIERRK